MISAMRTRASCPSRSAYHFGCRCDGCTLANTTYAAAWREQNRERVRTANSASRRRTRARRRNGGTS